MTIVAALEATAIGPAGTTAFEAIVRAPGDGTEPGALAATVTADGELTEALRPRDSRRQTLGLRITIDGQVVDPAQIVGDVRIVLRSTGFNEADFAVPAYGSIPEFRWAIGNPWALAGPAPGLGAIDIEGFYVTSNGSHSYRLMTDGLAASNEVAEDDGRWLMFVTMLGPGARYQRTPVSISLPPGHQTPRLEVIHQIAELAGVESIDIGSGGKPMRKEVVLENTDWLGLAQELAELEGYRLGWDADGSLTLFPRLPDPSLDPSMIVDARDLLAGLGTRTSFESDVVTSVRLTTVEELADGTCERTTTERTQEVLGLSLPARAHWRITSAGLNAQTLPAGEGPSLRVQRRVVTRTEHQCSTVVGEKVTTWGLKNPEVWRFSLVDDGLPVPGEPRVILQNIGAYVLEAEADPAGNGREAARLWPVDRLVIETERWTVPTFDDRGWKVAVAVSEKGWAIRRQALKDRLTATITPWEEVPLLHPVYTLANGEAVELPGETYSQGTVGQPEDVPGLFGVIRTRETRTFDVTDDGYIVAEQQRTEAQHLPTGQRYLYNSNEESNEAAEIFGVVSGEDVLYAELGDSHRKITTRLDFRDNKLGEPADGDAIVTEEVEGYLPTAERLADGTDVPDRGSTRLIDHACHSSVLEETHPASHIDDTVEYAEDEEDLQSLCLQKLREGSVIRVDLAFPALFALRPGMQLFGLLPVIGLRHLALIEEVEHVAEAEGSIYTLARGIIRAI